MFRINMTTLEVTATGSLVNLHIREKAKRNEGRAKWNGIWNSVLAQAEDNIAFAKKTSVETPGSTRREINVLTRILDLPWEGVLEKRKESKRNS